jgi:N-acetylglucosaminyldiphosphoundecaprenol N-acetyl-beta-D-mannosaminyltransferase
MPIHLKHQGGTKRDRPRETVDCETESAPIWVWGLPLAPLTLAGTVERVKALVEARVPSFFVTANLNYAMLTSRTESLRVVNKRAVFLIADGMPLVWASGWQGKRLPERVAGSDLIYAISDLAQRQGYRIFLLGGAPGVANTAAQNLLAAYPDLQIVGTVSPPYRDLTEQETALLLDEIRAARTDILIVALAQPKGEMWISEHYQTLGIPLCVQLGASIDFVAQRVSRAPRWIQKVGLEWVYRLWLEPKRLGPRYLRNGLFFGKMFAGHVRAKITGRKVGETAFYPD